MDDLIKKAKAVIIGHAIGDALGVPVEFCSREYLNENPVTDMLGYGTHDAPKGTWSDDTSMALCALESLSKGKIDYDDIMNNFCKWYNFGEFTATGFMFDIGITCCQAIENYYINKLPYNKCGLEDEYSNGNGSLMRIHPFTLYFIRNNWDKKSKKHLDEIFKASALTHAHTRSKIACSIYSFILWNLIENPCKESVTQGLNDFNSVFIQPDLHNAINELHLFHRIFRGLENAPRDTIKGDGYVVNSLEAAIWCLLTTDSYSGCVLKAVNLGEDTDTTAAIAGGLAGALYGYDAIPEDWKNSLIKRDYIEELCEKALKL